MSDLIYNDSDILIISKIYTLSTRLILKISLLIFALILFLKPLYGANLTNTKASIGDTTDKINFKDFHFFANKNERDILWPYLNESSSKTSFSFDFYHRYQKGQNFKFKFNEVQARWSRIFIDKHQLSLSTGLYHIDEEAITSVATKVSGKLTLLSQFNKDLNTLFSFGRGSAIREIFLTGRNLDDLKATHFSATGQYHFYKQFFSIKATASKHYLSNDVERNFFDSEVMASLMKYPHWVRIGFGYHTMDYNKNTLNYWSPLDFYAYGPRIDLSYVFTDKFQVFFGGNYNWFEENKTFSGSGYYMKTGARYGIREDFTLDLAYERNESIQNSNSWVGEAVIINFSLFL